MPPKDIMLYSLPIKVNLLIMDKNGMPAVELRRVTNDIEVIRMLVGAALKGQTIMILPSFSDRIKSLSSLIDKGIIYLDPNDQQYYFNQ